MENVLVSVVIPCYNQAQFLRECVDSVLNSSYQNVEIIVVDDGSTLPEHIEILHNFVAPKTRIVHQSNGGLSSARNAGITDANGQYILPLDCDDMVSVEFIGKAVAIMESDPKVSIVSGQAEFFGACPRKIPKADKYEGVESMLENNCFFATSMFRRCDWLVAGGFCTQMKYGMEDWDFWLSILELGQGRTAVQIDELSMHYRQHATGSMLGQLQSDKSKKVMMLNMILNRHIGLYMSHPDAVANFIYNNYSISEINIKPHSALRYYAKWQKYRKLFRMMWVVCVALLIALIFTAIYA